MNERVLSKEREEQLNKEIADFEQQFEAKQREIEQQREDYYKGKPGRKSKTVDPSKNRKHRSDHVTVYNAKTAAKKKRVKRVFKESFIHRTIRLIKGLNATKKYIAGYNKQFPLTKEKKRKLYAAVFKDAWEPVTTFFSTMVDSFWNFLVELWQDFVEIIFFFANIFITIGYYIGSVFLYIWDVLWDIRIWIESRKTAVFQYFTVTVSVVALMLIFISTLSGYEYSYYGRKLGITRTKQEVYQTIDALGDKLSQASGTNVNIDVERDIVFTRVFGFNLQVDNSEDILNTLTYMRDIQVRAWAIRIDGQQIVVLENEQTAKSVLQDVRNTYAPELKGVVYSSIEYDQEIEIAEVGVMLGDIWNPGEAVNYIVTGSTKPVDDDAKKPLVTLRTVETATYDTQVKFGAKYVESSEYYEGEKELISSGIYGINEVVAEVSRVNGAEIRRIVQSSTRTKNPVDAVYYIGTKPIPEKRGTGTFMWPIKNMLKRNITSKFGSRNTGIIGASTNHEGLDMGVPTGTKVYACDGGVVTFSGWRAGYGYVVIVDHGGLYETRYGHCSKLLVSAGETIYQGQNIALVGSTGISSGPHLHLEIRYNGKAKNPLDILPPLTN